MGKYFRRDKYQINMLSVDYFNKWIEENPQFKGKIDYAKFKRYWKYFRIEFYNELLKNPDGIDLQFFMGNISIKILDIDFKCSKDFLSTIRTDNGEKKRILFPSVDNPKKGKIVWKKNRMFKKIPGYLGMEAAKSFKKAVGQGIRNRTKFYKKLARYDKVPSKCTEIKKISLFDLAIFLFLWIKISILLH